MGRIDEGVYQLKQTLEDLIRHGLSTSNISEHSFWDNLAKRMLDAQAPGLASQVRQLEHTLSSGHFAESHFLHQAGSIYLLLETWNKREKCSPELQKEIEQLVGISPKKEDLIAKPNQIGSEHLKDQWIVISRNLSNIDNLNMIQSWVYGVKPGRFGKKLSFSPSPSKPHDPWLMGNHVNTELAFYPGLSPSRITPVDEGSPTEAYNFSPAHYLQVCKDFETMLNGYAECRSSNPWHRYHPAILKLQLAEGESPRLIDCDGSALQAELTTKQIRVIEALTGNHPSFFFVEWNGYKLKPYSLISHLQWQSL